MTETYGSLRFDAEEKKWVLAARPHVLLRAKRLFERISKGEFGEVRLTDTAANARELSWFTERYPLTMTPADSVKLDLRCDEHRAREDKVRAILRPDYVPPDIELAIPLREYQKTAAALTLTNEALLLGDDIGLGKTASAIGVLANKDALPALVVTLTHLPKQWASEIQRFVPGLRAHVLTSGKPYDLMRVRRRNVPFPDVIVSNYHKLGSWADVLGEKIRTVIFDEAQELRTGGGTHKWRAAAYLASKAKYRMQLTATPIYNYGAEIFNVLSVIFPEELGSYEEFIREWCGGNNYAMERASIKEPRAFGTYLRDAGIMLRRTRKEVGRELPDLTRVPHMIDAEMEAFEAIESSAVELAKVLLTQTGMEPGAKLKAAEELSWMLRQATGVAKAPFVADFVRLLVEQGERVVLFGWHHVVYDIWKERLTDFKPALYTGEQSSAQKEAAKQAFISGESKVLIVSLRAGAGLDGLQHVSRTVVIGELDWSPQVLDQCIGRVHRDGQDDKVVAYIMLSDHGSDPVVADVLGVKRAQSEGIRNPDGEIVDQLVGGAADVKRLAASFLKQCGVDLPPPPPEKESAKAAP